MSWHSALLVAGSPVVPRLATSRAKWEIRHWTRLVLALPVPFLLTRWDACKRVWQELAGILPLTWRLVAGRRLPAPSATSVRVRSKEDEK